MHGYRQLVSGFCFLFRIAGWPQFPAAAAGMLMATVPPGEYRVVLSVGGRDYTQTALIMAER